MLPPPNSTVYCQKKELEPRGTKFDDSVMY